LQCFPDPLAILTGREEEGELSRRGRGGEGKEGEWGREG